MMDHIIECPLGAPVCVALKTYPAKVDAGKVFIAV